MLLVTNTTHTQVHGVLHHTCDAHSTAMREFQLQHSALSLNCVWAKKFSFHPTLTGQGPMGITFTIQTQKKKMSHMIHCLKPHAKQDSRTHLCLAVPVELQKEMQSMCLCHSASCARCQRHRQHAWILEQCHGNCVV